MYKNNPEEYENIFQRIGLSVSLRSYTNLTNAIGDNPEKIEITTFSYGYDTIRLTGMVQGSSIGRCYNIVNNGPSPLQIAHIADGGEDGINRFEIVYMGEAVPELS